MCLHFIWDHEEERLQKLLSHVNGQEKRIQFTMEREKNRVLAFLDLKMERVREKVVTSVYRKETHTFRYLHWSSNHPKKTNLGVMKCLIHRIGCATGLISLAKISGKRSTKGEQKW